MCAEIAVMTAADCDEVLLFWANMPGVGLNESDTPELLSAYFRRNPGLSFVARRDGRVVGAVLCGHDGRRGYLHHLAVAPERRHQGLGTALVERCLSALASLGITRCNIFVFADNHEGHEFWLRGGWTEREDLRMMQRLLTPRENDRSACAPA
jgi:putative acetyltransferase